MEKKEKNMSFLPKRTIVKVMKNATGFTAGQFHEHLGNDFTSFIHGLPCGAALHRLVFDEKGNAVDYMTLDVNQAFEEKMKIRRKQVLSRPASERMSPDELKHWIDLLDPVVQQHTDIHFDLYDKQGRRYKAFATSPGKDLFLIFFSLSDGFREESRIMTVMRDSYSVLNDMYLRILQNHSVRPDLETGIILERVCKSLDLDFGGVWQSDRSGRARLVEHFLREREVDPDELHCYPRLFPCIVEKINKGSESFFISREMIHEHRYQDLVALDRLDVRHLFFSGLNINRTSNPGLVCFACSHDNLLFGYTTKGYLDLVVLYLQTLLDRSV